MGSSKIFSKLSSGCVCVEVAHSRANVVVVVGFACPTRPIDILADLGFISTQSCMSDFPWTNLSHLERHDIKFEEIFERDKRHVDRKSHQVPLRLLR